MRIQKRFGCTNGKDHFEAVVGINLGNLGESAERNETYDNRDKQLWFHVFKFLKVEQAAGKMVAKEQ
jgi:hypothetical protein